MLAVILALFVLLSFSCAPAVDPDEPDPDENDVDVEPDPDPVEEPGEPQRVVVAQAQGVGSWDPPQDWLTAPEWLIQNAYDSIMVRSGDGSEFLPELAREWEHIDDYTFRLYLQEGVRFHDGTELTAEDVKFHWELTVVVNLDSYHFVKVKIESLQGNNKVSWQLFYADSLQSVDFLVTLFTVIGILSLKHISLDKGRETLLD